MEGYKSSPAEGILAKSRPLFDLLQQTCSQYIFACDMQSRCCIVSEKLAEDFALPRGISHDFINFWEGLIHPEDRPRYRDSLRAVLVEGRKDIPDIVYRAKARRGEYVWLQCSGRVRCNKSGQGVLFAGVMSKLVQKGKVDMLTGLLNKYQFETAVKESLEQYRLTGDGGALMIFGIDNFKIINETYNRFFGDAVLRRMAKRIEDILPAAITLYKLDGDEFGIIYRGATEEMVEELFSNVQRSAMLPQEIDHKMYFCTISAGTVFFPQGGKDYLVLHKHAEAALDLAKNQGKNKNCLFSREKYNRWKRSIAMRDELKSSVENGCSGFDLFFQPQVDAVSRKLCGAEALLRWGNSKGKMVAPMEFIPLLEETKLIIPVGKWVFERAVVVCKQWQKLVPEFHMSVNVSYEQLKDVTFKEFILDCIRRYDITPGSMTLELTESRIVADWSFVNRTFDFFREQGIVIAMDDFGTGYSSLSYLKNLSTDIVKMDREFVRKILFNDFDKRLVEYTVRLCHSIGMQVCIEGVETVAEYRVLTEICNADLIQGYLFGHPESQENFVQKFICDEEILRVEV